jgi:carbon monoxide dehydrogenase subunit G
MEIGISGSETIPRSPAEIWSHITDPSALLRRLSGVEFLKVGETRFNIAFRLKVGVLGGLFRGVLEIDDLLAPESCRVRIDARGRAGAIAGWTDVRLCPVETGLVTRLDFETLVTISGLLKAAGARLAKRIGESFAESLLRRIQSEASPRGSSRDEG